jgi:hypothetical protein
MLRGKKQQVGNDGEIVDARESLPECLLKDVAHSQLRSACGAGDVECRVC